MARAFLGKAVWAVVALAALASAGYAARDTLTGFLPRPASGTEAPVQRPAQPVRITRIAFASADATQAFTGTIRPQHETPLGFRLAGRIIARTVDVGDRVTAGQTVARLDDTDARLHLAAAKAELAAARTDLARATADLARSRDLFARGHIAQAALDRAISAAAEAASRADRAEQTHSLALNQLSYTDLVAETDGIVTATSAEPGQVVAAGQPVLSIARMDALDVVFALPEQQRDLLATAQAGATLWGAADRTYALSLRDISPDVDPAGRTYRVRMTIAAPDAETTLGRTVTVALRTAGAQPSAPLPLAAVVNDGTGAFVWRLPEGADRVERVPVVLVSADDHIAWVRGPIADGDRIISLGAHKVDPARPVRVVETAPTPES